MLFDCFDRWVGLIFEWSLVYLCEARARWAPDYKRPVTRGCGRCCKFKCLLDSCVFDIVGKRKRMEVYSVTLRLRIEDPSNNPVTDVITERGSSKIEEHVTQKRTLEAFLLWAGYKPCMFSHHATPTFVLSLFISCSSPISLAWPCCRPKNCSLQKLNI